MLSCLSYNRQYIFIVLVEVLLAWLHIVMERLMQNYLINNNNNVNFYLMLMCKITRELRYRKTMMLY